MTLEKQYSLQAYVCNECCCSKKDWYFGPINVLVLHTYIVSTF